MVEAKLIGSCAMGKDGTVGEFDDDIEEGIPYITGNVLWALYQFITFIVLLSVLRARWSTPTTGSSERRTSSGNSSG